MAVPLLAISNLEVRYSGVVQAVRGVSLDIRANEIFGLVGESGSGKTTLAMCVLGSLPISAEVRRGSIRFAEKDLVRASPAEWRAVRWRKLAYVPQGAMNALNPVARIKRQFADLVRDHEGEPLKGAWITRVEESLQAVRLPAEVLRAYPHELSGGMKQRVCIAMAILFRPKLIIADESTSALDVVSQRVVLQTLLKVRSDFNTSIVLIGHDLALQAQVADRIGIMFGGHLVEVGATVDIFDRPAHPYTRRLIASVPSIRHRDGIPDIALPDEAERESWQREEMPLLEVTPGHFARATGSPA